MQIINKSAREVQDLLKNTSAFLRSTGFFDEYECEKAQKLADSLDELSDLVENEAQNERREAHKLIQKKQKSNKIMKEAYKAFCEF